MFTTNAQSTTSITFSWNEPYNGGDAITDYEIDWNQGDTINTFTRLVSTTYGTRVHTVNGLTVNGLVYRFIVRAINSVGKSANSDSYSVIGASTPSPPSSFVRSNAQTS